MKKTIKKYLIKITAFLIIFLVSFGIINQTNAKPPTFEKTFSFLEKWTVVKSNVNKDKTLLQNIKVLFYPSSENINNHNIIFNVIRNLTVWFMLIYIIYAWAKLLFNKKPEDLKNNLMSIGFIILWWVFIYGANRLFASVLNFEWWSFAWWEWDIWWAAKAIENEVLKSVLTFIKAAAFFYAIVMIVVTWFKIIHEWDGEKSRKLIKWIINVVAALIIIKWVDVLYQMAYDSSTFITTATSFIKSAAKVFAYLYGIVIVLMVFASWYLYLTDWWNWNWFKKASNILLNIILSAIILFGFLLIIYQILDEFSTDWNADIIKQWQTSINLIVNKNLENIW